MATATPTGAFPEIDARRQERVTDDQARFFRENGLLVVRNLLRGDELAALREQTLPLVRRAVDEQPDDPDYSYKAHALTGERVPYRIEYVIDKTTAGKALLGHPFILRSVEQLQGPNFVPTWDSMVFKVEGAGAAIPWHRDAAPYQDPDIDDDVAAINVDFYLDGSDETNCLWGLPGSNRWSAEEAAERIARLNADGFGTEGAVPLPMAPGDVIFHNILALHGSPPAASQLRRVIYYEFRPAEVERRFGPHTPPYIPLKQGLLLACLRDRAAAPYAAGETPFSYAPTGPFALPDSPSASVNTYRYPHSEYWR